MRRSQGKVKTADVTDIRLAEARPRPSAQKAIWALRNLNRATSSGANRHLRFFVRPRRCGPSTEAGWAPRRDPCPTPSGRTRSRLEEQTRLSRRRGALMEAAKTRAWVARRRSIASSISRR